MVRFAIVASNVKNIMDDATVLSLVAVINMIYMPKIYLDISD